MYKVKKTNPFLANFRCPFCGDSNKNKIKARGYVYERQGSLFYRCHNCGAGTTVANFIKQLDPLLYKDYCLECFAESGGKPKKSLEQLAPVKTTPNPTILYNPFKGHMKVSQLDPDHPSKQYVVSRKIPNFYHSRMYHVEKFKAFTNSLIPDKFTEPFTYDETRLVMPFYDFDGSLIGFQGRSFIPDDKIRYISIMLDENRPKIYGLDTMNSKTIIYVVEGAIDSMFVPNSIAMLGSDVNLARLGLTPENFTFVYDNERRNKDIVKRMHRTISAGYPICLWPEMEQKDINEMILAGYNDKWIKDCIDKNTVSGMKANLALTQWRKS